MRAALFLFLVFVSHLVFAQRDSASYFVINTIHLEGNKTTKSQIVFRELTFQVGDTIPKNQIVKEFERTQYNLKNTLLFNFISIDTCQSAKGGLDVTIWLTERWYIFPIPFVEIAERNFNAWWQNKDFSRLDYGVYVIKNNFRGRKENIIGLIRLGYNEQYRFTYEVPFINKKQTLGLTFTSGYSQHNEINYAAEENKQQFVKNNDERVRKEIDGFVNLLYRQGLYGTHSLGAGYNYAWAQDTILKLNSEYFHSNENEIQYFTLNYSFSYDLRDYKVYPLKGQFIEVDLNRYGLGLLKNERTKVWTLEANYQRFFQLSKRWFFGTSVKGKVSSSVYQPYYVQRGLGYFLDNIRGYESYVIDGRHFGLLKTNLKFAVVSPKVFKIGFLPKGKFNPIPYALYANIFYDSGYVYDNQFNQGNPMANEYQHGFGLGLDFVTYYDRVLRVEYSYNKFGESGFFVHFTSAF